MNSHDTLQDQRGTINAVEGTIMQVFSLAVFAAAIIVPDPERKEKEEDNS